MRQLSQYEISSCEISGGKNFAFKELEFNDYKVFIPYPVGKVVKKVFEKGFETAAVGSVVAFLTKQELKDVSDKNNSWGYLGAAAVSIGGRAMIEDCVIDPFYEYFDLDMG